MISLFNFDCCACTKNKLRTDMVSAGDLFVVHA